MKKFIKKIMVLMACFCVGFGFAFSPIVAGAEEVTTETGTVTPAPTEPNEDEEVSTAIYFCKISEEKDVTIELVDKSKAKLTFFKNGQEIMSAIVTYQKVEDIIDIFLDGEWQGAFRLNGDGTATDITYQYNDTTPETEPNDELTFDDILGVFGGIAESEGYGSEWERVVEQLKTAASEKQVTISTVAVVVMLVVFIVYLVFRAIKRKHLINTFKELSGDLKAVSAVANEQLKGTNALIDEANANVKVSEKTKAATETIKKEEQKIEKALSLLISAFMTFSEGCKYSASKKSVVEINCAQALKELESLGGQADENHEV